MQHTHNDGRVCSDIHTLDEIGRELGVTRERVRQIEKIALRKLSRNPKLKLLFEQFAAQQAQR